MDGDLIITLNSLTTKTVFFLTFYQNRPFQNSYPLLQLALPEIKQNTPAFFPMEIRNTITTLTFNLQLCSWVPKSRFFIILSGLDCSFHCFSLNMVHRPICQVVCNSLGGRNNIYHRNG